MNQYQTFTMTHCWNLSCQNQPIIRLVNDIYGDPCPKCGQTLQNHPFFGLNMEFDKGNPEKWQVWTHMMSDQEKAQVYIRYGFPVPHWLM